jgi:hypothetical protein
LKNKRRRKNPELRGKGQKKDNNKSAILTPRLDANANAGTGK